MAEEEDDDESFGDFTFASFPSQPFPSTTNDNNNVLVDNDWGDFVNHSSQINNDLSKPLPDPTTKHVNGNNGVAVQAEAAKKPKGAIPLSIFGEEEEEEEEKEERTIANVFPNGGVVKGGSGSNGSVGINDLISSLYNHQLPQMDSLNGPVSVSNVAAPNSANSKGSKLNEDEDEEDEDGWEFKSAEWETGIKSQDVKAEMQKHDNGALQVVTVSNPSNGISDKAGGWHLEFELSPLFASQNHINPQPGLNSESKDVGTGFAMPSQSFGELNSGSGSNQNLKALEKADIHPTSMELLKFDSTLGSSLASISHQSDEWNFGVNFNSSSVAEDSHSSETHLKRIETKINQTDNSINNASPTNINVNSDVNLFESDGAITRQEKPPTGSENRREALPLSIFGDETPDTDEQSVSQDLSHYTPTSPVRNNFNSLASNLSINDIWNLYNQAEKQTSPNVTPEASENQILALPEEPGSSLVTDNDGLDDDFWDFKDASTGSRFTHESSQQTSFSYTSQVDDNGLHSSPAVLNSDLANGEDDFEDDSWEFKDAIPGTQSQDTSTLDHTDLPRTQLSTKLEQSDYTEFYSKLKDELCNYILSHLQNLKKTLNDAALSGEDAKAKALEEQIQEFSEILHQDKMSVPTEYLSEDYCPTNVCFNELFEVLKEPKFQPFESEYQLASRLLTAEKDIKSAIELLKDTVSTLRILKLGSREEQCNYLTMWSKIAVVCSQELKHGAYVWKQAILQNVHDQILSNRQGVQYIIALGEIYRVAEIIGASIKLHKPWMLSDYIDHKSLCFLLDECYSIWLASGLQEALLSISSRNNFEPDEISRELVESIKYIHELDEHALRSYVISGEQTTCQLSALPAGCIPGLNLVTWNGKHCIVKLANLWVNLISSDSPKK